MLFKDFLSILALVAILFSEKEMTFKLEIVFTVIKHFAPNH